MSPAIAITDNSPAQQEDSIASPTPSSVNGFAPSAPEGNLAAAANTTSHLNPSTLLGSSLNAIGKSIDRPLTPNHEPRVFFFDIDNCLYQKSTGIPEMMRERIENFFKNLGFPAGDVQHLAYRYYVDYGLAIRGLVKNHPEMDVHEYDAQVDGSLPLEEVLKPDPELRKIIQSMNIEKKWLFTNAGKFHGERVVRILGIADLFDGITYCDYHEQDFACKPEKKAFAKAMHEAGVVHHSNCFLVDDSAANIDTATDLGWTTVHVADDPEVSSFGHFQIADIHDLPKVLPEFWCQPPLKPPCRPENSVYQVHAEAVMLD